MDNGWILAKDRLPEENKLVVACLKVIEKNVQGYLYVIASYIEGNWFSQYHDLRFMHISYCGEWEVVAWLDFQEINYEEVEKRMIKRYRKNTFLLEGIQLTETNHDECIEFITGIPDSYDFGKPCEDGSIMGATLGNGLYVSTPQGMIIAKNTDYIIKFEDGTITTCNADVFNNIFEEVKDE